LKEKINQYQQRIDNYNLQRAKFKRFQRYFPISRLITFVLCCVLIYFFVSTHNYFYISTAILSFIAFLVLGHLDIKYKTKILKLDLLIKINQNEIDAVNGDFSKNDGGNEFTDFDHPYTYDLDIFGKSSLFQCINRTSTFYGKIKLAEFLENAFKYKNEISERQQAICELAENIEFRQQFQLIFSDKKTNESDLSEMSRWLQSDIISEGKIKRYKSILYLLNVISISTLIFTIAGLLSYQIITALVLLQLFLSGRFIKNIFKIQDVITSKFRILNKYSQCLSLIENTNFKSSILLNLKNTLTNQEANAPSKAINNLFRLINFMDTNLNLLVAFFLNGFFLFSIHLTLAVEIWKNKYKQFIPGWFDVVGDIDALSSMGNFAFNNPDFTYPKPVTENFIFSAKNIGHPLISKGICVKNDIEINGWKQVNIITGANMSGKSTLLRTVGANYILAMTGCPVCADEFIFMPVEIYTSMRTNDSLAKKESYFFAELKRLKEIIDELEMGKTKFILLDEILKGTNSNDKRTGSMALINQLLKYNIIAMVATHDQILGELKKDHPANLTNLCFEIVIANDKMQIDYKIREGVCQNLNASYLMKNMGILFPEK